MASSGHDAEAPGEATGSDRKTIDLEVTQDIKKYDAFQHGQSQL